MHAYTMSFIRTDPSIDWDARGDDWDAGLINFGFKECERLEPIPLKSIDLEAAKAEAAGHWQEYLSDMHTENAEGYWITTEEGRIPHVHVAIEEEDRVK